METNTNIIEPPRIRLATVVFRAIAGVLGGGFGSAVIFLVIILTQSLITGAFDNTTSFNPIFIFIILAMAFLSIQVAAIASASLFAYIENYKYTRLTSTLVQIFLINLLMFVVMIPAYIVISQVNSEALIYVGATHVVFSVIASTLIMEIMTEYRYAILSVYTTIASVMIAILVILFVQFSASEILILPLLAMLPIVWGCVGLFIGAGEMVYGWIYETYGVDYLSLDTNYGEEYSEKVEQDELDADIDND
jgi:hypothetical protein